MKIYSILLSVIFLTLLSCEMDPCMNKESFLKSYDAFIEKVESQEISTRDWKAYDVKFEKYITECYERHENTLTLDEKKDFWIKSMKYYRVKYGEDFYEKFNEENDILAQRISSEVEKVFTNSGQDVIKYIKEVYGDDLEKTIDNVVDEIEKIGEELKNILSK